MHFRSQRENLLTTREISTRLTLAQRLHSKVSEDTSSAIVEELDGLPEQTLRTIAHGNGGEFARHEAVGGRIGCQPISVTLTALGNAAASGMPMDG